MDLGFGVYVRFRAFQLLGSWDLGLRVSGRGLNGSGDLVSSSYVVIKFNRGDSNPKP